MSFEKHQKFQENNLEEVPVSSHAQPIDIEEERKLLRKIDGRIMPITCLFYLFAYLDRSNLGNARLQGLPQDILHGDPTGHLFDWVTSVFYFAYILCMVPATVTSKLFQPRVWMCCIAIGWGLSSTLMATAFDFAGLMTGRLFLGVFESGFAGTIPLYFSLFYTKADMGVRMAYWFSFAAVAGSFPLLDAQYHSDITIDRWRLLFIIEGCPSIIMGLVAILFLPNRPESTSFFNERERVVALERMNRGASADVGAQVTKAHIPLAFRDWRCYAGGVIYFGLNCALASISAFLPTILATFGFTNAIAQILTVPPYAGTISSPLFDFSSLSSLVAAIMLVTFSMASDRMQSRGTFMATACTISGIGYVILLTVPSNEHARYFAVFCIVSGTYTTIGLLIAWCERSTHPLSSLAHNLGSETKRATGMSIFMSIGQCGSVLGSHLFPLTEGPRYIKGFGVSCALMFLAAIISLVLSISYRRDNARRDALYGKPQPGAPVDTSELADKANGFRYVI
ncbi:MFS general substrate transporter [Mycena pura]|uniref:MFS general substrate transporter n=1 Tax=Mycena pura TaxID=153505 RepID=A0AAD6V825_9AGAR|nr:MFS general substrate transporter [Mycena pura]